MCVRNLQIVELLFIDEMFSSVSGKSFEGFLIFSKAFLKDQLTGISFAFKNKDK